MHGGTQVKWFGVSWTASVQVTTTQCLFNGDVEGRVLRGVYTKKKTTGIVVCVISRHLAAYCQGLIRRH